MKPRIKRDYWVAVEASSEGDAKQQAHDAVKDRGHRPPPVGRIEHPAYDAAFSLGHRASSEPPTVVSAYAVFDYNAYKDQDADAVLSESPNYMVQVSPIY